MKKNNNPRNIRLGKKNDKGYKYASSIDFTKQEGLFPQIERVKKEREIKNKLEEIIEELKPYIKQFKNKKENIDYYYNIGLIMQFLDKPPFKEVKEYSAFRMIYELLPEILPHISNAGRATKNIAIMYYLGKINSKYLQRATFTQWYEILKFRDVYKYKSLLDKLLIECEKGISEISLRNKIKELKNSANL